MKCVEKRNTWMYGLIGVKSETMGVVGCDDGNGGVYRFRVLLKHTRMNVWLYAWKG